MVPVLGTGMGIYAGCALILGGGRGVEGVIEHIHGSCTKNGGYCEDLMGWSKGFRKTPISLFLGLGNERVDSFTDRT